MNLATRALERWELGDARLTAFAESPTAVYKVEPGPFALRVGAAPGLSDAMVASQLAWLRALDAELGLPVPAPIDLPDGSSFASVDGRRCVLLRWIEGESLLALEPVDAAREVGRSIGLLHAHSRSWTPPSGFACPTRSVAVPSAASLGCDAAEFAALNEALQCVLAAMDELGRSPATYGLIHYDLNFRNFVWSGGQACPIDFDEFGFGYYLSDLAEPLRVITHYPDFDELQAALLEGYRSEQQLSTEEERLLPRFIAGTFLSVLSWACRPESACRRAEILACLPDWLRIIRRLLAS